MAPPKDVATLATDDLMLLRQKVQGLLSEGAYPLDDAQDAYVSALIGHLFATLLTGFGPGLTGIDRSPERLAAALNTIATKLSAIAGSLDPAAEYRIEILKRDKS